MPLVRGRERELARVAAGARRMLIGTRKGVGTVAARARRARGVRGGVRCGQVTVATGARRDLRARVSTVRCVAIDAGTLGSVLNHDAVVTTGTGIGRAGGSVRRMATRADRVRGDLGGNQRGFDAVASNAGLLTPGREAMRLMAVDAALVARGTRPRWLLVTIPASRDGQSRRRMLSVAIETIFRTRVLGVLRRTLLVTAHTVRAKDRTLLVDAVAFRTFFFCMHQNGGRVTLRLRMASDTCGRATVGGEHMAAQAIGLRLR